jgi:hypothetical protein
LEAQRRAAGTRGELEFFEGDFPELTDKPRAGG